MRKLYLIVSLTIALLSIHQVKAQDLTNYDLYVQNPVLYNPAYTVDSVKMKAFLNSRLQWVGIDGAPRSNLFSIYGNFKNNMGVGISVSNFKQGLTSNTYVDINYGYRVHFAEDHYLTLGISLGTLSNNLDVSKVSSSTDFTDQQLIDNSYKQLTISSKAGLSYVYKNFEVQVVMPQMLENNTVSNYTLGIIGYNFKLSPIVDLKLVSMIRGVSTSPAQIDFNAVGTWKKMVWFQASYRSNKSYLFAAGFNYKMISLGYASEINTNVYSVISKSSHEIQLIYSFGGLVH